MSAAYIKIFHDFPEKTSRLSDEEVGRLVKAMVIYSRDGVEADLPGNEDFLFPVFKAQIDTDKSAYAEISAKRKAAGSRGGKAKVANATNCKQEIIDNNDDSRCNNKSSSQNTVSSVVVGNSYRTTEDIAYYGTGHCEQVVALAKERAAQFGHDGDRKYILAILRDWSAQGVKTEDDARAVIAAYDAKKHGSSSKTGDRRDHGYQHHEYTDADFGEDFYYDPSRDFVGGSV